MRVKVNGQDETIEKDNMSIEDYLNARGIHPQTVAVELNMSVLHKAKYGDFVLKEGDELEIVKFVGGGAL